MSKRIKDLVKKFCSTLFDLLNDIVAELPDYDAFEQSDISKRLILNGRDNRKIKGEVTSIKVARHLADGVKLKEDA